MVSAIAAMVAVEQRSRAFGETVGPPGGRVPGQRPGLQPTGPTRVTLACDESHTLLLKDDGTVLAWGRNEHGQLGTGSEDDSPTPVAVAGLSDVIAIAANHSVSLALRRDGTVWTWGNNEWGQLGDGTYDSRPAPAQIPGLAGIVAISAGSMHALALKDDGSIWAWGSNERSRLGDGSLDDQASPQRVLGITGAMAIAAGELNNLALLQDGSIWRWGFVPELDPGLEQGTTAATSGTRKPRTHRSRDRAGDLPTFGIPREPNRRLVPVKPSQIFRLEGATAVAVALHNFLALKSDGSVWIMGENEFGQLGDGTNAANWKSFVPVRALQGIFAIAARSEDLLVLGSDGSVWQWGQSVGLSTVSSAFDSAKPVRVSAAAGAVALATGGDNDAALRRDATVIHWGVDPAGQVEAPSSSTPIAGAECVPPGIGNSRPTTSPAVLPDSKVVR